MRMIWIAGLLGGLCGVGAAQGVIRPKVVVVGYFEVGNDTGDRPGEIQYWVERDHLDRVIQVPGMTRAVRANADGSEIAVAVGPGEHQAGGEPDGSGQRSALRPARELLAHQRDCRNLA